MSVEVRFVDGHHFIGTDEKNNVTVFDSRGDVPPQGATPVSAMLQALAACSGIDVVDILKKKRKTIDSFVIRCEGTRAETHPKVFTKVHMHYVLHSPDATEGDLERSIHLSHETYCTISAMFARSGCEITSTFELLQTTDNTVTHG